jgi:hypothetical protein
MTLLLCSEIVESCELGDAAQRSHNYMSRAKDGLEVINEGGDKNIDDARPNRPLDVTYIAVRNQ